MILSRKGIARYGGLSRTGPLRLMKGRPTQKNAHPNKNSLHKQFAQTISGQFVQTVHLFPLEQAENRQKSLRKLFVQTVFIWVGGFWGGSPSLERPLHSSIAISLTIYIYRGHLGLSAQSPKKVSKRVPGPLGPRGEKSQKKVENGVKNLKTT